MAGQRPGGVTEYWGATEARAIATSTCAHCASITEIPNRRQMFDYVDVCRRCMSLVCLRCSNGDCIPQEKWAEIIERAGMRCDAV